MKLLNPRKLVGIGFLSLNALALVGCSTIIEDDPIDYKSVRSGTNLDVPPDLQQLSSNIRFKRTADGALSASDIAKDRKSDADKTAAETAPLQAGDVTVQRDGSNRWLLINRPVDQLWVPVRDFWVSQGFVLTIDDPKLGIVETDWAENRSKLPQDAVRSVLGKVLESLYSTSERDKFRVRLERGSNPNETLLYLTSKGMVEEFKSDKSTTVWVMRPRDQEVEAEFLRRLMFRLGSNEASASAIAAQIKEKADPKAKIVSDENRSIELNEPFERAWRTVGLGLDRSGFTVEERNREKGIYTVRATETLTDAEKPGFWARIQGASADDLKTIKYLVTVQPIEGGKTSLIQLKGEDGKPSTTANSGNLLKLILNALN